MDVAVDSLLTACETMFMVSLETRGEVEDFDPAGMEFGGRISMIRADGVWDFALFGSRMSCENLVRVMNGLEDEEDCPDEEIVDLLGELVNMVSGSVKKEMGSGEAKSSTTIPFFLEGEECLKIKTKSIPLLGRRIGSEEFEGEVYFVFSERNSAGLIREIGVNLDEVLASGANLGGASTSGDEIDLGVGEPKEWDEDDLEILQEFLDESYDELDGCEAALNEAQSNGEASEENVNEVFRKIHSIKGVASSFDLEDITTLTHITEEVLDAARNEKVVLGGVVLDTVFESVDLTRKMLDELKRALLASEDVRPFPQRPPLCARLEAILEGGDSPLEAVSGKDQEEGADGEIPEWDDDDLEILQEFLDESYDELSDCEAALNSAQEAGEASREHVDELFRKIHSIKGVASSFDLEDITNLTHITEEVLAAARDEKLTVAGGILTTIFDSVDVTRRLLDVLKSAMMTSSAIARLPEVPTLCMALDGILEGKIPEASVLGGASEDEPESEGIDAWALGQILALLEELGESLPEWAHETIGEGVSTGQELLMGVINGDFVEPSPVLNHLHAIVDALIEPLDKNKPYQPLPMPEFAKAGVGRSEGEEEEGPKKARETVKVDVELLNELEVLAQSLMKAQELVASKLSELNASPDEFGEIQKLSNTIASVTAKMRMVEVRPVFQKMSRMVRDLSKKTEKLVKLVIQGEDTMLDRVMAEKISAPLVHMVRNAVDHGLEDADGRKAAGKPPLGTIRLRAHSVDEKIVVEIGDDGKGLDASKLIERALEKEIIAPDHGLSDADAYKLIFAPGFSTAAAVTSISGRGVGMDVVRREIESLGGEIVIETALGVGSTFKLVMPLIAQE